MSSRILTSDVIGIDVLLHDHHAVLAKSTGGAVAVFANNAPAFYAVTPARMAELLALEEKLSRPGSDVALDAQFYEEPEAAPVAIPCGKFAMYPAWQPDADFQRQAALWGVALREPVTAEELAAFIAYWQAEGKVFHHIQWQQKLARSVQISRSSNGGMPQRDINSVSEPDNHIPPGFRGNDENVGDLMQRLQKMMPAHITPAFKTGEELLAWQKEQGEIRAAALARENRAMKMQRTFNRSGIRPLHQNCSFDNYRVECDGQMNALSKARQYVDEFDGNIASFVFSGKPGTGKNHLAAAICNELLLRGKSVLIITVADIMSAMKDTFSNRETSEEQLLNDLSNVDLLVIDEIGVQTESRYEKVIINQIVDRRSSSKRPTGMLTNSNMEEMTKMLGERVMDRMRLGNSLWVNFTWDSYRSRVTGKEY